MDDWRSEPTDMFLAAVRSFILSRAAMSAAYPSWSDEFARSQVLEAWTDSDFRPFDRRVTIAELQAMSPEKLHDFGFSKWDDDLRLIPLWVYNYIADGEKLTSISGDKKLKGADNIGLDVRFGCIAWGFASK